MFWFIRVALAVPHLVCSYFGFSAKPNGFLRSYCDLGMVIQWAVLLHSVGLFNHGFCKLLHSLWSYFLTVGLHPAGASVSYKYAHSHSFCRHFMERDKPQTATDDKATTKARRTLKAMLLWPKPVFPLNIFSPSLSYFISPPPHTLIPFFILFFNFLSVCSIWTQSKGYS